MSSPSSPFLYEGQCRDEVPHDVAHAVVGPAVRSIPDNAFSGCDSLTALELPAGLRSVGEYALAYCDSLLSISLPDSVHTVHEHAFDNCRSLRDVRVSAGRSSNLRTLGTEAFRSCHSLQAIDLPEGVKVIPRGLLSDCRSLTRAGIPSSVEVIDDDAFRECLSLLSVTLGNRLVRIGIAAFYSCTSLINVKIPPSVKAIEDGAFDACDHLLSVEIAEGLNEIGHDVFSQCRSLLNVAIPLSTKCPAGGDIFGRGQLSDRYPTVKSLRTRFDGLPIHGLCYDQAHHPEPASVELLRRVLEQDPGASSFSSDNGQADALGMTPFHILAVSVKPNVSLFSELLKILPAELVQTRTADGRTPLQLLEGNPAFGSASLIRLILEVTILNPSKFLGLEAWREEVAAAVRASSRALESVRGRDRRIRKIQDKYAKYERLEATSLLEQAIWKAKNADRHSRRPRGGGDGGRKQQPKKRRVPVVTVESRQRCRVTSGAQVIIPNVAVFLSQERPN